MAIDAVIRLRMVGAPEAASEMEKLRDTADRIKKDTDETSYDDLADSAVNADLSVKGLATSAGGIAGGAILLGGAFLHLANKAAEAAEEADTLAKSLDTDVETASALVAVFEDMGLSASDVNSVALKTSEALQKNATIADLLGISLEQAKNPVEALRAGFDGWDLLTPTERVKIFGQTGQAQLAGLIDDGETLDDVLSDVSDGRIISDDDVAAGKELSDNVADLKENWDEAALSIGQRVVPEVNKLFGIIEDLDIRSASIPDQINGWGDALKLAAPGWFVVDGAANKLNETLGITKPTIEGLAEATNELVGPTENYSSAVVDAGLRWKDTEIAALTALAEINRGIEAGEEALDDWKKALNIDQQAAEMYDALLAAWGGTQEEIAEAEGKVIDFISALGDVSDSDIDDIRIAFNEGDLAAVEGALARITRTREIVLKVRPPNTYVPPSGFRPGVPDGVSRTTNVNVTMAGTPSSRELASTLAYWEARS